MRPTDALIACHLGLPHEPVGIVLVERVETLEGEFDKARGRWPTVVRYVVERIERTPAGTRLTEVAQLVEGLCRPAFSRSSVLVNVTASGRQPAQLMRDHNLKPIPIVTTQADATRRGRGAIHVPQKELVTSLSIIMGERRLSAPRDAPNAEILAEQLREFRTKPQPKNRLEPFREEQPGELVLALALACWWGDTRLTSLVKQPPAPRLPPDPNPPLTFDMALKLAKRQRTVRTRI